jgi:imidazolonepropionase-like amidohydrolase
MTHVLLGSMVLTGADEPPLAGGAVRVRDGRIAAVLRDYGRAAREDGDEVLDVRPGVLVPGLIDLHEHLNGDGKYSIGDDSIRPSEGTWAIVAAHYARQCLGRGITTVRTVGTPHHIDIALRRLIAEGLAVGPRLACAGQKLAMTGGHGSAKSRVVDGPHEAMKAVREQVKAGADLIKLTASGGVGITREGEEPTQPEMTVEEMRAACEVAHHAGLRVTVHADGVPGIRNSIAAGVDCIEHGIFLRAEEAREMARRGVALVPTLSTMHGIAFRGRALGMPESWIPIALDILEPHQDSFRAALEAGVLFGAGTDGFGEMVAELQMFVKAGVSPYRALQAATRDAARIIGWERRLGTLEPGRLADLLAVPGNPLEDLTVLRAPRLVMRDGVVWFADPAVAPSVLGRPPASP